MNDINKITDEERAIVEDHFTRAQQLNNLRRVMASSITPKKLKKLEDETLPQYILRERNARTKAERVMKKYGMRWK